MNILRLGFTDTFDSVKQYFTNLLSERYEVIRDDSRPDYLIFGDRNFGNNNMTFNGKNCIKIFYTGENQRPTDYQCHYSISFDHDEANGHNYRLPLYVIYDTIYSEKNDPCAKNAERNGSDLTKERKFCSFVVKNGSCDMRNKWFHRLNSYKPVSSGGPHYNNIGYVLSRNDDGPRAKYDFLSNHKFSLCFENTNHPGYATEKLYESLCAKTIPIYWGSPTIDIDFNPRAFLNWHDYRNDDAFFEAIKEVDEDPYLYEEMYLEPMFADYKTKNKFMDRDRFLNWFDNYVYKGVLNNV